MSISAYVGQLHLGRACQMLVQTDMPVRYTTADCGFSDAARLARRFRKARSAAPSCCRRAFRGV